MRTKLLAVLLTLALTVGMLCVAGAEGNYVELEGSSIVLSRYCDTLGYRAVNSNTYSLIDTQGNALTDSIYTYMYADSSYPFFKVETNSQDGIHREGLIDGQGNVVIPTQYADVNILSERWAYGIKLTPSSSDDKDYTYTNYSTGDKSFYRIDTVDFYYRGTMVGTLNRSDFDGYPSAYGDYVCISTRAGQKAFYNSRMEKSPVTDGYSEYSSNSNGWVHNGSGQAAFTAGCTLTRDEVEQYLMNDYKGNVFNLQGDVVFTHDFDYMNSFRGGYSVVTRNSMEGLVDESGNVIIEPLYDDIGNYEAHPLAFGCISAVKDGKFGFLDASGNVTCEFKYNSSIVDNRGTFASIQDLDGSYIVLSGLAGELPEHYAEVSFIYEGGRCFVGKNEAGQYTLVDLNGQTLIPYMDANSMEFNREGTIAVVSMGNHIYRIYTFDNGQAPAAQPAAQAPAADSAEPVSAENPDAPAAAPDANAAAATADDGTWTCSNGHPGNTGNFCTQCGEAKPTEAAAITQCPNCGHQFEDGAVPNFCPECGTQIQ